jgi:hypothetical protein
MQNNKEIIKKLKKTTESKLKKFKSNIEFFLFLRDKSFTRLELMILDSVVKKMPLENLPHTLLLLDDIYYKILESITNKLKMI